MLRSYLEVVLRMEGRVHMKISEAQTKRREVWEEYYSALCQLPKRLKKPVPFVVEALPLFRDYGVKAVLDLGCGLGRHCIYLAKMGFKVIGIDISRSALKTAKAWSRMEKIGNVTVLRATMTNLPFISQCFQAAFSISVIHHSVKREIRRTTEEIYRVLNNNGLFLANLLSTEDYRHGSGQEVEDGTFIVSEDFEEKRFDEIHHFFTKKEIQDLLANFRKIKIESIQSGKKERLHCYWGVTAIK